MARDLIPGDKTLKAIKPGDPRKRISDGGGLYLLLFVKGGAHGWRFDYAHAGKRKTLSLGTYPDTSLALARTKADEARKLLAEGTDPSDVRKQTKAEQQIQAAADKRENLGLPPADSFEAVARDWLATVHESKVSAGHVERTRLRLEQNVFPWLGRKPIADVTAPDVLTCLRRVEARGAIETAHRIKTVCGQVFRFGIAEGKCTRDHAADLRDAMTPVTVTHRAAITDPKQVGELLRAMHDYQGLPTTRSALLLAPLVFVRPGELRQAEWAEFDLDAAEWKIPAERMKLIKAKKAEGGFHWVPLASQAVALLRDLHPLTGHGRYVFPSPRSDDRPISDNAVLSALRRMGFAKDEMTGHGFRAMARTLLQERLGVEVAIIEAQLAHAVKDSLGRAYNRTEFLVQRRQMMQLWADHLDRLRVGAEVLPFKQA
jgi:integrase